ncbi:C2 domain-containing protein [Mycotypha africana]|uniref:C2 domain-containing protein n=1 Tax=Mycotypha africana TaxID=64632 RepID=UPI0023008974|nr:C2 domain-containing protein [Mycotypha africana]KAI8973422.1 C2 domain-containing protein [Mycotypha africana]
MGYSMQDNTGKIHLKMDWKPILLTNYVSGLTRGSYRSPIDVVHINSNKATDLKNVEVLTGGKSDPYVRVMSGLQVRERTEAVLDNLNPVCDNALYVPIHSMREDLTLEVVDYNDVQSDKFLGMMELIIKDIVQEKKIEGEQNVFEPRASFTCQTKC